MDDSRWISEFITLAATYNTLSNYKGTVANDVYIELIKALNTYKTAVRAEAKAEALKEAAGRMHAWQKKLCAQDGWECDGCADCDDVRATILADQAPEAGKAEGPKLRDVVAWINKVDRSEWYVDYCSSTPDITMAYSMGWIPVVLMRRAEVERRIQEGR